MTDIVEALRVAQADASANYRDLTPYEVRLFMEGGDWHVDYELRNPGMRGGGPHYVISGATGEILSRRYEQ